MPTIKYHWNPVLDCVMHETDENGDVTVEYTHEPTRYGPLLSERRDGTEYVHHYDALGSTIAITDEAGAVTDTFAYDAWGTVDSHNGPSPSEYVYIGRLGYYRSNGAYYVRHRTYKASLGCWMAIDPMSLVGPYTYVNNAPTMLVDPSGLVPWRDVGISCPLSCNKFDFKYRFGPLNGLGSLNISPVVPITFGTGADNEYGVGVAISIALNQGVQFAKLACCCDDFQFIQTRISTWIDPELPAPYNMAESLDVEYDKGKLSATVPYYSPVYPQNKRPTVGRFAPPELIQFPQGYKTMYDLPSFTFNRNGIRPPNNIATKTFETCAVCVRNDKPGKTPFEDIPSTNEILQCVTWGFTGHVQPAGSGPAIFLGPAIPIPGRCSGAPSATFLKILKRHFPDYVFEVSTGG